MKRKKYFIGKFRLRYKQRVFGMELHVDLYQGKAVTNEEENLQLFKDVPSE